MSGDGLVRPGREASVPSAPPYRGSSESCFCLSPSKRSLKERIGQWSSSSHACWRGGRACGCCALALASPLTSPVATLPPLPHPEKYRNGFVARDACEVLREALQGDQLENLRRGLASPPGSVLAGLRAHAGLLAGQVQEHVAKVSCFSLWPPLTAMEQMTRKLG